MMNKPDPLQRNHVTVTGKLDASRSIVFVHGFGNDQTAWTQVAASFLPDYRIILLDNTGAGQSDPAAFVQSQYLNLRAYSADLVEVCQALHLQDAILVGHSVGAMIGALAAIAQPALFSKLVLIGMSPRYRDDAGYHGGFTDNALDALYRAVATNYADWADQFAPLAMGNPDQPRLARHFAETLKSIPAERALTVLCAIFQSDHRADLPKLDRPTLLVQSQDDPAVPMEVAQYLHQHIRGSRLCVIRATGHLPHVSAPDAVVAAMRDFIAGP